MADSTQEKTEQPTARRREEAVEKGQVAYSRELTGAILFLLGLTTLKLGGETLVEALGGAIAAMFRLPVAGLDEETPGAFLAHIGNDVLRRIMPVLAVAFVATLLPGLAQTGLKLSLKKIRPDPEKVNPLKGVKRLVSLKSLVLVLMSLLKVALVGVVVCVTIEAHLPELASLSGKRLGETIAVLLELVFLLGFRVAAGLLVLGFLDLLFQRWKHEKDLMMTKEDVREERKKTEGDPRIKGKIREVQRQMALQRMKADVRTADVVVRNPTHFAVALKYDRGQDGSPRVVAKGRGKMALQIIEIAEKHDVEVVSNPPLARELYRSCRLGDFIPERLFKAVAEILAWVFKKRMRRETPRG